MALLFMDSFDHYVTADLLEKWTAWEAAAWTISAGSGRHGSNALHAAAAAYWISKAVPASPTTIVVGFAYKAPGLGNWALVLSEASVAHVGLRIEVDGSISVHRMTGGSFSFSSAATLGTSAPGIVTAATFLYIEIKTTIHDTTGTVEVRVGGSATPILNLTGLDTRNGGTGLVSVFYLSTYGGGGVGVDYDDLYVLDGTGAAPWNSFLGDCRVDACLPTGAGATTGWTPLAGANWAAVDDTAPDDDTTYTSTSTVNAVDTFVVQDAPVAGATLYGVQHCLSIKKMDAGTCSVAPVVRHAGTDTVGTAIASSTSYGYGLAINQVNPGTGAQWTEAGFNAAEFGYKRTA